MSTVIIFLNLKYRKNKVETIGKAPFKKKKLQNVNKKIRTETCKGLLSGRGSDSPSVAK